LNPSSLSFDSWEDRRKNSFSCRSSGIFYTGVSMGTPGMRRGAAEESLTVQTVPTPPPTKPASPADPIKKNLRGKSSTEVKKKKKE